MAVTDSNQTNNSIKPIDFNKIVDLRIDNFDDLLPEGEPGIEEYVSSPFGTSQESYSVSGGVSNRLTKNKTKYKSGVDTPGGPASAYLDSKEREKLSKEPLSEDELVQRIKSMPDNMLPKFVKENAEIIVKEFKINTKQKVANFLGQVASESLRGVSEYVYYRNADDFRKVFSSRIAGNDIEEFVYDEKYLTSGTGYGFKSKNPWDVEGWPDTYYGARSAPRMGNQYRNVSEAENGFEKAKKGKAPDDFHDDPGFYKGSPDGYAYRGHGIIQITGKVQYEYMNKIFGKGGKHEDKEVVDKGYDFLKNPEIVSYNWKNTGNPNKYALLSSLMWWENNAGVYIDEVSLPTTKTITGAVRGRSDGYQERHDVVLKYYDWLLLGKAPQNFTGVGVLKTSLKASASGGYSGGTSTSRWGTITYVPQSGDSRNGDGITITNSYASDNIRVFNIPQLAKIKNPVGTQRRFHKNVGPIMQNFFAEIEKLGLLHHVITYNGDWVPRFIRQTNGRNPRPLSPHAWGTAFDINVAWNPFKKPPAPRGSYGSVWELIPTATKFGISWGGAWSRTPDGMHFEVS